MGLSCGSKGKLTLTNDDVIEKSNLSQQFMFRDWNIGQEKSTIALAAAIAINPTLKVEALQNLVSLETKTVFDDTFWENLDVIVNLGKIGVSGFFWKRHQPKEICFCPNRRSRRQQMRSARDAQARELLEHVVEVLIDERCKTFEDCILWARKKFEDYFVNHVKQLTFTFPEEATTSFETPIWSAPKHFPRALEYMSNDPAYLSLSNREW